jgi:hypothetical protein
MMEQWTLSFSSQSFDRSRLGGGSAGKLGNGKVRAAADNPAGARPSVVNNVEERRSDFHRSAAASFSLAGPLRAGTFIAFSRYISSNIAHLSRESSLAQVLSHGVFVWRLAHPDEDAPATHFAFDGLASTPAKRASQRMSRKRRSPKGRSPKRISTGVPSSRHHIDAWQV